MSEAQNLTLRSQSNEEIGAIALPSELQAPVRKHLLYEAVKMQTANRRAGTAATKTRAFVRGGGKKPWRQKGTGRARSGSSRSPIWVGGATIFGPQPRDYSYRIPRSARRAALQSAVALKVREGKLIVLDKIELAAMKTKEVVRLLDGLGVAKALIVVPAADPVLEKAARNLPNVKVLRAEGANVYDILRFDHLVVTQSALAALASRVGEALMDAYRIIEAPLITEKGTLVTEQANQVVFRVHPKANKLEIRRAIESLFKVKVEQVHTVRMLGKKRRVGRSMGKRPDWKKAYVTLAEGQRIDFFEAV